MSNPLNGILGSSGGGSGGSGDVVGPASSTDNALVRFDGLTGKLIQNSGVTIADTTGSMTGPASQAWELASGSSGSLRLSGTGTDASGSYLTIAGATYTQFMMKAGGRFIASADTYLLWGGNPTAGSYGDVGTPDVGIGRNAAGVLRVTQDLSGIGKLLNAVLVEANTAGSGTPNAIAATESGTVFTNEGATAKNYEALPTAAAGYQFTFIVQDADGMRIVANTGDTIRVIDKVTAAAGYIESTTIGSVVTLVAINATEWVATSIHGTWTDGTFTYDDTSLTTP